ncbi:hypothetical protein YC2023_087316 [Brassica napus]
MWAKLSNDLHLFGSNGCGNSAAGAETVGSLSFCDIELENKAKEVAELKTERLT